jgi:3',5'-cyclic AMP phosphodiesterase CpdA
MRTIAHISDLHFGRVDPRVAEALVEDLSQRTPTVLVVSGDFTQRARRWQYQDAAKFITRLPGPQLLVPGNHDIPLYDVIRRFFFPLSYYRRHISTNLRPCFQDEELFVLGINTARSFTFKGGRISEEQLLDVKLRVCPLPATMFKVVVTHHPFIPPPREPDADVVQNGET